MYAYYCIAYGHVWLANYFKLLHLLKIVTSIYADISAINSQPKLKDLYDFITPNYAAHWKVIGTLLGIATGTLDVIKRKFPNDVRLCCNELLRTWLETDTGASCKKLIEVINSPAVTVLMTTTFVSSQVLYGN